MISFKNLKILKIDHKFTINNKRYIIFLNNNEYLFKWITTCISTRNQIERWN